MKILWKDKSQWCIYFSLLACLSYQSSVGISTQPFHWNSPPHLLDHVYQSCDDKTASILTSLDLSAAFDTQFIDCSLQFWVWHRRLGAEVVCHVSQEESNSSNLVLTPPLQSPLSMVFHKDQSLDYYFLQHRYHP